MPAALLQVKGDLVIALVAIDWTLAYQDFARLTRSLSLPCAQQQIPGAFDVGGGEGLPSCHFTP